jgi:hypothetical protein
MIKELFSFIGGVFSFIGKILLWIWIKIKYLLVALKEIHDIKKHNTFKDKRVEYLVKSSKLDD